VIFLLAGCQNKLFPSPTPTGIIPKLQTKSPHIRGSIIEINQNNGKISGIYVVGKKEADYENILQSFLQAFGISNWDEKKKQPKGGNLVIK